MVPTSVHGFSPFSSKWWRMKSKGKAGTAKEQVVLGIDFGTESGRVLVVRVRDGEQISLTVVPYANGVIEERLPSGPLLDQDWALQSPHDWLELLRAGIPKA